MNILSFIFPSHLRFFLNKKKEVAISPIDCRDLTTITIPKKVTIDGKKYIVKTISNVFYNCSSLRRITIPNSVTTIEYGTFRNWSSLTKITIPNSVTTIGSNAFDKCSSLRKVTISNSLRSIEKQTFAGCLSLKKINIPDSVTAIGDDAFILCSNLIEITISNSVNSIGNDVFAGCSRLNTIKVAPNNQSFCDIDGVLFSKDKSILYHYPAGKDDRAYTIPDSVCSIDCAAFEQCKNLRKITIPQSVTTIGERAFNGCPNLTEVTFQQSVTNIGKGAFNHCPNLKKIILPNSVTTIGDRAFSICTSLIEVIIPNTVTTIGNEAFAECSNLSTIFIPNSVVNIGNNAFGGSFGGSKLKQIKVDSSNPYFCDIDGVLFSKDKTILYQYPAGKEDLAYLIPNFVTNIRELAFCNCSNLRSIIISDSVITIEECAFLGCSSLREVTIPNSVVGIGDKAFSLCYSLTNVYCYAKRIPRIGKETFAFLTETTRLRNVLWVPHLSKYSYMAWHNFGTIKDIEDISSNVIAANELSISVANGSVIVTGVADDDKICNVTTDGKIESRAMVACGQARIAILPNCTLTANIGGKVIKIKVELELQNKTEMNL